MVQVPSLCAIFLCQSSLGFPYTSTVTLDPYIHGWQHSGVSQAHWCPCNWMLLCTISTFSCAVHNVFHVWIILFCSCFLHLASFCCSRAFCSYLKKPMSSFLFKLHCRLFMFKSWKSWILISVHRSLLLGCPYLLSGAPVSTNSVSMYDKWPTVRKVSAFQSHTQGHTGFFK